MPLSHSHTQALPGNFSGSSRKRSHAEITRSQSRSQSPPPPSKRRRTSWSSYHRRTSASTDRSSPSENLTRYPGDGLDHRRPVMSGAANSQQHNADTIDLTLEDDSPPPRSRSTAYVPLNSASAISNPQSTMRAPPFPPHDISLSQPVINLSSDDEDEDEVEPNHPMGDGAQLAPSSPEIQFMGERALPRPPGVNRHFSGLPAPLPHISSFGSVASLLRNMTHNIFYGGGHRELPEDALNRIDGLLNHPAVGRGGLDQPPDAFIDEYDGLQMDYNTAAFGVGNEFLIIEDGNLHHLPNGAHRRNEAVYKEPAPARDGYTRNYDEDDLLICGYCDDELATGKTEQKQQVWIIKACGHAYCGDCAHNRVMTKSRTKDTKRPGTKKTNGFRTCTVPGCTKAVDSKTKMFQIYL